MLCIYWSQTLGFGIDILRQIQNWILMKCLPAQSSTMLEHKKVGDFRFYLVILRDITLMFYAAVIQPKKAMYISRSQAKLNDVSTSIFSAKAYFPYYFFPSNCYSSRWLYWDLNLHEKKKQLFLKDPLYLSPPNLQILDPKSTES